MSSSSKKEKKRKTWMRLVESIELSLILIFNKKKLCRLERKLLAKWFQEVFYINMKL